MHLNEPFATVLVALVAQLSTSFPVKEKVPSILSLSMKVTFKVPVAPEQPPVP